MNQVRKTFKESGEGYTYITPKTKVVTLSPEGLLCLSVALLQQFHEVDCINDEFWK